MTDSKTLYFKLKRLNNLLSREELKKVDEVVTAFYNEKIQIRKNLEIVCNSEHYTLNGFEVPVLMYLIYDRFTEDEFLKAFRVDKVFEYRTLLTGDVRALCIEKNWYTKGDTRDYKYLLWDLVGNKENVTTKDLIEIAKDIVAHSDIDMSSYDDSVTEFDLVFTELQQICKMHYRTFLTEKIIRK